MIPLIGYGDRLSVRPGETIEFKVSSQNPAPFEASLVRIVCADPNPAGPGIQEATVAADFAGSYPSRAQAIAQGSHARIEDCAALGACDDPAGASRASSPDSTLRPAPVLRWPWARTAAPPPSWAGTGTARCA